MWSTLLVLVAVTLNSLTAQTPGSNTSESNVLDDITEYIATLDYDRDKVLAYQGDTFASIKQKEGELDNKRNFIVTRRKKKFLSNGKGDIGITSKTQDHTFPGSILLANSQLVKGNPEILQVKRKPLNYTVNLPGLTDEDGSFRIIPNALNYNTAHNKVLNTWFKKYSGTSVSADYQSEYSLVYSKEQFRVQFGVENKDSEFESSIDFDSTQKNERLILVGKYQLVFYTVTIEDPPPPGQLFPPDVDVEEIYRSIDSENPPVLVDSVSFGRTIFIVVETSSTNQSAKDILQYELTNFGSDPEKDWSRELEDFSINVYVLGGYLENRDVITARNMRDVEEVIKKYLKLSRNNLGFPVSYSGIFLKDNSIAVVQGTTEYIETSRTVYSNGVIILEQRGSYAGRWIVTWDEVNIDDEGNDVVIRRGWRDNGRSFTSPMTESIELAGNCRNIDILAQRRSGILFLRKWRTFIDLRGIPLIRWRNFKISGVLKPILSINPPL